MTREIRYGKRVLRLAVNKIGGKRAGRRITSTVGQLGLQNPGSAGADKYAHAFLAVFVSGSFYCFGKAVLFQS